MSDDVSMTNCGELADYLATQPRDRRVVMSRDAEGNGFSPLAEADESMYVADSTWSGAIFLTPEQIADLSSQEDAAPDGAERVVCLWPTN